MGLDVPHRPADGMSLAHAPRATRPTIADVADRAVAALQSSSDVCVMAQAATDVALELVAGATTVDVSVVTGSKVVPIARSGLPLQDVDILMADCGEGPPFAAIESSPVVAPALGRDPRWPLFGPRAARRGVTGAISVSIELGHEPCAMTFWFSSGAGVDDTVELHSLLIASLLGAAAPFATEATNLHRALRSRDVIGQAKGILMERHRVTEDGAFEMLVDASSRSGHKLISIAERLARTGKVDGWPKTRSG